jgi:lipopolysaccharide/colanic/teichoic acid biosynthesis glycosyltransferase
LTVGNQSHKAAYKIRFDFTVLVLAHLILLPIWLVLWTCIPLLIWLGDRGPVFYRQLRAGKDGQPFTVLKFRTMVLDAELKGPAWTTDGDPRVTRVGRLLRRTALDELPEIVNIFKRDMSFVGPRALDVEEQRSLEEQIPGFEKRLQVSPGLTGLAQVYNRGDDSHKKYQYDLSYLDRMGPWLDAKLLVLSVWNTFGCRWDQRRGKTEKSETTTTQFKESSRQCQEESHGKADGDHQSTS